MTLRKYFKDKPKDCFSCVPPDTYADRFYDFINKNLFTQERKFPESEIEKEKKGKPNNNQITGSAQKKK